MNIPALMMDRLTVLWLFMIKIAAATAAYGD